MINNELLKKISILNKELKDLRNRLKTMDKKEKTITTDTVQASSTEYPYTQYNAKVEGVKYFKTKHSKYTYRKQIKSKEHKLEKLINQLEYELNYISDEDSEIRQIIRYRYEDDLSWIQIMFKMGYKSESVAKMKLKRFLENL